MGNIEEREMFRVFNMGIGMMLIVSEKECAAVLEQLKMEALGEMASLIGHIEKREDDQEKVVLTENRS